MPSKCRQPFTQLKVQMDGKVFACSQGQYIGNINDYSIDEIWNGNTILELRRRLVEDDYDSMCKSCPLFNNLAKDIYSKMPGDYMSIKKIDKKYFIEDEEIQNKEVSLSNLDLVSRSQKGIKIVGWAIDAEKNKCIDNILMLVNGSIENCIYKLVEREDVALALKNKIMTSSGFEIEHDFISIEKKIELVLISKGEIVGVIHVKA